MSFDYLLGLGTIQNLVVHRSLHPGALQKGQGAGQMLPDHCSILLPVCPPHREIVICIKPIAEQCSVGTKNKGSLLPTSDYGKDGGTRIPGMAKVRKMLARVESLSLMPGWKPSGSVWPGRQQAQSMLIEA